MRRRGVAERPATRDLDVGTLRREADRARRFYGVDDVRDGLFDAGFEAVTSTLTADRVVLAQATRSRDAYSRPGNVPPSTERFCPDTNPACALQR